MYQSRKALSVSSTASSSAHGKRLSQRGFRLGRAHGHHRHFSAGLLLYLKACFDGMRIIGVIMEGTPSLIKVFVQGLS